jgi:hypothetical protein
MEPRPLTLDTSPEVEQMQIERWRAMTPQQKASMISGLSRLANRLAMIGIRERYPEASEREQFLRFAMLTLGRDLAEKAYPEVAALPRP